MVSRKEVKLGDEYTEALLEEGFSADEIAKARAELKIPEVLDPPNDRDVLNHLRAKRNGTSSFCVDNGTESE
ncbi:MAG TPA: hypothetical protein VGA53_05150 [Candidatus Paceibacterota bacterium]